MTVASRPRHPITGRRFYLRAKSPRELAAYQHRLDSLRTELRLNMRTQADVDRELRHLQHGPVTLERAAIGFMARPGLAKNTRRGVRSLLEEHLRELAPRLLASLDVPTCTAWLEQLARAGLEKTTIGTCWRKLRMIGRYALERGWIGVLPWGDWRPRLGGRSSQRLPREAARNVDELVALLFAARALDELAPRARYEGLEAKIAVAGLLGLRQGELGGLRWPDVGTESVERDGLERIVCTVFVGRQFDGQPLKRGCEPMVFETIPELGAILDRHRRELEERGLYARRGPVFPKRVTSAPGAPAHHTGGEVLSRASLRRAVQRAGLPHTKAWSGHSLRDTFVTLEVAATGGDLKRVQARSRHASLASLVRYVRALSRNTPAPPALQILPGFRADDAGSLARNHNPKRNAAEAAPEGAREAAAASTEGIEPCIPHPLARTSTE